MPRLELSGDRLTATLVLAPNEHLTPDALAAFLAEAGVRHGLLADAVQAAANQPGPAAWVVARGTPAEPGRDGRITYAFRTGRAALRPRVAADGRVDFRNLGLVVNVRPGQVLARHEPPVPGRPGRTVLDEPIAPAPVKDVRLRAGCGAQLSDDGGAIVATTAGNPHLEGSVVLVRQEYQVIGDVGLETGHVEFDGDLVIRGDVGLQMVVRATGDVTVHGHIEGATLTAGGSIRVAGGVRRGSSLVAGNDILATRAEGSSLRCGGSLTLAEDLVQSMAEAGASASIGGAVVGGRVQVAGWLEARVAGARLGTPTELVTQAPARPEEARVIAEERATIQAHLERIAPRVREAHEALRRDDLPTPDLEVLRKVLALASSLTERDAALAEQALALEASPAGRSGIHVLEQIHPGVRLRVGHAQRALAEPHPPGTWLEEAGALRLVPIA